MCQQCIEYVLLSNSLLKTSLVQSLRSIKVEAAVWTGDCEQFCCCLTKIVYFVCGSFHLRPYNSAARLRCL